MTRHPMYAKRPTMFCDRCESTVYGDDVQVPDSEPGELWRYIAGFGERYAVSNYGRVHSFPKTMRPDHKKSAWDRPHQKIKGTVFPSGHLRVGLYTADSRAPVSRFVHVLVMDAFVGPRQDGMQVRHLDGNPLNNRLDNLAYGTPKQNAADRTAHGRTWVKPIGAPKAKLTPDDVREIRSSSMSNMECARHYGVSLFVIQAVRSYRSWRHVA